MFTEKGYWLTDENQLCFDYCDWKNITCPEEVSTIDECKLVARVNNKSHDFPSTTFPMASYTNDWISPVVPRHCTVAIESEKIYFNSHWEGDRHPRYRQVCMSTGN